MNWGVLALRIVDSLERHGPMTSSDLQEHLGIGYRLGGAVFKRLMDKQEIRISAWRRDQDGQRKYIRAVYAAGPGSNAHRPRPIAHRDSVRRNVQNAQAKLQAIYPGITQKQARAIVAKRSLP